MAPKRLLEDPPPASSSAEEDTEEEESSEEESQDEKEEQEQNKTPKSDHNTPPTKPSKNPPSSSTDNDESDSETESDNSQPSPSASAFTIKPIASKPMKDTRGKSQQPQKKSTPLKPASVSVSGGVKRSKEGESKDFEKKDVKKRKVGPSSNNGQQEDLKKASSSSSSRLWSEDDEVAILKGMIDYQTEKGSDPWADLEAFLRFIKENLHVDVNKDQLKSKIKRLKSKYHGNVEKGKDFVGKEHDSRIFDLSKKIWGAHKNNNNNGVAMANESAKKKRKPVTTQSKKMIAALELPNDDVKVEKARLPNVDAKSDSSRSDLSFVDELLSHGKALSIPEGLKDVMKEGLAMVGSEKIKELESSWRELQEEELRLYVKKVELVRDYAKLVLGAMK